MCLKKLRVLPLHPKVKVMGKQGQALAAFVPTLRTAGVGALVPSQGRQPGEPSPSLPLPAPLTSAPRLRKPSRLWPWCHVGQEARPRHLTSSHVLFLFLCSCRFSSFKPR